MSDNGVMLVGTFAATGNHSVAEELANRLLARGTPVITTSSRRGRLARLFDTVATIWRRRADYSVAQVDVYSGPAFRLAEAACWTLRRANKPYVLALRGGNLPNFSRERTRRVRSLLASADCVTTPSQYLLEEMIPYREDIQLLPNPLPIDRYPFRLRETPSHSVVWLRSFRNIYNAPLAPAALSHLTEEFPEIRLTMVGPDKRDGSLAETKRVAEERFVADRVEIVGPVSKEDVPKWLNRADVFINTTNVENTPISVLEAMACGLCVVSTNVGGTPYLLTQEHDALLVPPDDPPAMAAAMKRIWKEPELAKHLSANARATAEQFDWPGILPQWEHILADASNRGAKLSLLSC